MKAVQSEIKENIQGTCSEGKKTRTQIYGLEQKEEINIQLEQNEETRIQKDEEWLRNLWDNFKPYNITGTPRQRNMAQMKEQIKTLEKELSDKKLDNLSHAEFKTLVIRMLTEMTEFSCKMKEEMKAIQSEIKENMQGTNSEGKETGTQINDLEQKEEINIQPKQNEETRMQKNE